MFGREADRDEDAGADPADAPGRAARRARPCELMRESARAGMTHGRARRPRRAAHPRRRRRCRRSSAYRADRAIDFPATLCISVNDEVVHGIPGARVLADGDLVSIDCGAIVDGWHGDAAISLVVRRRRATRGPGADRVHRGVAVARHRAPCASGDRLYDVGAAVEDFVDGRRRPGRRPAYGIVEEYVGHGIGTLDARGPAGAQLPGARPRARRSRPGCAWRSSRC